MWHITNSSNTKQFFWGWFSFMWKPFGRTGFENVLSLCLYSIIILSNAEIVSSNILFRASFASTSEYHQSLNQYFQQSQIALLTDKSTADLSVLNLHVYPLLSISDTFHSGMHSLEELHLADKTYQVSQSLCHQ